MSAGFDTTQIRVAGKGHIYVATVGTAGPTDTTTAWGAGWQDLGYTSDAGVTFHKADTFNPVPLWQSMVPGRYVAQSREVSFKFTLVQMNAVTLPLWGGGGAVAAGTAAGEYEFDIASELVAYERALGIEIVDGTITYRFTVPRSMVTTTDDLALTRTKNMELGVTLSAMGIDESTPLVSVLLKDAAFAG